MYYEIDESTGHFRVRCKTDSLINPKQVYYYGIASANRLFDSEKDFPFVIRHSHHNHNILIATMDKKKIWDLAQWCNENIDGEWFVGYSWVGFFDELDAMAFKLVWD